VLSFAAPAFLWGLALLPLVVLLHRIRVRRERREVAGAFLWRRARDAGARRARMRPSVLLLLQLAAVTAASLAAARPQWDAAGPPLRVLVVDASVSMAASDGATSAAAAELATPPAGATRLDVARAVARERIADGGPVALIVLDADPSLVLAPTDDGAAARTAVDELTATSADADPERALRLARDVAAAADASGAEIHWLSDAPPPSRAGVVVHPLAGEGGNVGVTGFERVAGQAWLRLSSTWPRPLEQPIELRRGDQVVASATLLVPARGDASATFPVAAGAGPLQVVITPPPGDALASDDVAWAGSAGTIVALDQGFVALERALGAIDDVRVRVTSAAPGLDADLRVLHGRVDASGEVATLLLPQRDAPAVAATVERWDAADPLLRFVDLSDLVVAHLDPPPFGEAEGWTTLAYGVRVAADADATDADAADADAAPVLLPLIQRRDASGGPVVRLAFHPVRGDLTLRPAFPTLVVNLVDEVRGDDRVRLGEALPAGATRDGTPVAVADRPGLYRAEGRTLLASLLNEDETRLPAPAAFGTGGAPSEAPPSSTAVQGIRPRDVAVWGVAAAALLLLLEWWGWAGGPLPGLSRVRALRPDRSGP
jgi:hypothetical protein